MKLITTCPECGYKLGRSEGGTNTELKCPKCGAQLHYEILNDTVTIEILQHSEKVPRHIKTYAEQLSK